MNSWTDRHVVAFNAIRTGVLPTAHLLDGLALDALDERGYALIHHAFGHGRVEWVKAMPSQHCLPDKYGNLPAHLAVEFNRIEIIEAMLDVSPGSFDCRNAKNGNTPLMLAVKQGHDYYKLLDTDWSRRALNAKGKSTLQIALRARKSNSAYYAEISKIAANLISDWELQHAKEQGDLWTVDFIEQTRIINDLRKKLDEANKVREIMVTSIKRLTGQLSALVAGL